MKCDSNEILNSYWTPFLHTGIVININKHIAVTQWQTQLNSMLNWSTTSSWQGRDDDSNVRQPEVESKEEVDRPKLICYA